MKRLNELHALLGERFKSFYKKLGNPTDLYDPISYIIGLGGKRIRPAMVLASYKLFKDKISEDVLKLAECVEMFHNFTLMHDDIMDNANLRRGKETVHIKWNIPTAILSGDLLQILVNQKLSEIGNLEVIQLFNKMAIELCEGQMNDTLFEELEYVSNDDYLNMIRQKTAVLLGFSLQAGAILGGASKKDSQQLYNLGISLGLSFQLMDDYLDTYGTKAKVGKRIGGDILEKKKTYLWNEMWGSISKKEQYELLEANHTEEEEEEETITRVRSKMSETQSDVKTLALADSYTKESLELLTNLEIEGDKAYLEDIISLLSSRQS